jgi:hypothetical protein
MIPVELIKNGDPINDKEISKEWKVGWFPSMYKNCNRMCCNGYR